MEYHFDTKQSAYEFIFNYVHKASQVGAYFIENIGTDIEPIVYMRFKHFCVRFPEGERVIKQFYDTGCKEYMFVLEDKPDYLKCDAMAIVFSAAHNYVTEIFKEWVDYNCDSDVYIENMYKLAIGYLESKYELCDYQGGEEAGFIDDDFREYSDDYNGIIARVYNSISTRSNLERIHYENVKKEDINTREYLTVKEILTEGYNIAQLAKRLKSRGEFETATDMFIYADAYARAAGLCEGRGDEDNILSRKVELYLDFSELICKDDAMRVINANNGTVRVKDIFDEAKEFMNQYKEDANDPHCGIAPIADYQIAYYLVQVLLMSFDRGSADILEKERFILNKLKED